MTERPILFSSPMVRAILNGTKTQTRRVVKDLDLIYGISDDRILVIYTSEANRENEGWNPAQDYPGITEQRLHGRGGREYLLADALQRIWAQGFRGLVCVAWAQNREGLLERESLSRKQESDKNDSPSGLHGLPRNARERIASSATFGRESIQQQAEQSLLGHPGGELERPESPRDCERWRKALGLQANGRRATAFALGHSNRAVFTAPRREGAGYEPSFHLFLGPWQVGQKLWVRENFVIESSQDYALSESQHPRDGRPIWPNNAEDDAEGWAVPWYQATDGEPNIVSGDAEDERTRWRPSIHMPRWASRITLEVTEVRVQRLNEISEEDAKAEGSYLGRCSCVLPRPKSPVEALMDRNFKQTWCHIHGQEFKHLWQSINAKRPGASWDDNPWVWAVGFRRVRP